MCEDLDVAEGDNDALRVLDQLVAELGGASHGPTAVDKLRNVGGLGQYLCICVCVPTRMSGDSTLHSPYYIVELCREAGRWDRWDR